MATPPRNDAELPIGHAYLTGGTEGSAKDAVEVDVMTSVRISSMLGGLREQLSDNSSRESVTGVLYAARQYITKLDELLPAELRDELHSILGGFNEESITDTSSPELIRSYLGTVVAFCSSFFQNSQFRTTLDTSRATPNPMNNPSPIPVRPAQAPGQYL